MHVRGRGAGMHSGLELPSQDLHVCVCVRACVCACVRVCVSQYNVAIRGLGNDSRGCCSQV